MADKYVTLPNGETRLHCSRCDSPRATSCARDDCAVRGKLPASQFISPDWTPCRECCGLDGRHKDWCSHKVAH